MSNELSSTVPPVKKVSNEIRYDWYQTETHVIVTILAKNAQNVNIEYNESMINTSAKLPNGADYNLKLDLAHKIVPEQSLHKVFPSKIEIKLKKQDGYRWSALQQSSEQPQLKQISPNISNMNQPPKYPSSSKKPKDWDQVEKEIAKQEADEKTDSGDAVKEVLEKIYGQGSDEVRRAMNKSFQESGGTVLSTNWKQVCEQPVEKRPPDGLEWKSWQT
ncbi:protein SGT1 homolog [Trichogramma pretiosum]|uniref:protein SGT1 homolog n=1 Tax=Trichogramma pretiosum TaxID=7493 RepID=UPI0006C9DD37|nr:protein SGT1 homolog [Trichogramma pretiosum]